MTRKRMPSNYQIFDYWKDKALDGKYNTVIIDWGEPSCWACHKPIKVETQQLLDDGNFKEIWNRTSGYLERCHIVPKALGGSNEPENLFLMCPDCHDISPDIADRSVFLKWVTDKRKNCMFGIDIEETMRDFKVSCELNEVDHTEVLNFAASKDFKVDFDKVNTHGFKFSKSTLSLYWINEYKNNLMHT